MTTTTRQVSNHLSKRPPNLLWATALLAALLTGSAAAQAQELVVSAAASLTNAFEAVG